MVMDRSEMVIYNLGMVRDGHVQVNDGQGWSCNCQGWSGMSHIDQG